MCALLRRKDHGRFSVSAIEVKFMRIIDYLSSPAAKNWILIVPVTDITMLQSAPERCLK